VGKDIDVGGIASPANTVEAGTLRRCLEPLELDRALHHSREAAQAQGYPDVIAQYTAMVSFTLPPMCRSGGPPLFTWPEREARNPNGSAVKPPFPRILSAVPRIFRNRHRSCGTRNHRTLERSYRP